MPTADQRELPIPDAMRETLERLTRPSPAGELAAEIAALREEIAALRAELVPVPSLILTGREVAQQYRHLCALFGQEP